MNNNVTYIYRHLGKFKEEVFTVSPDGIEFEKKKYNWTEIEKIKRYDTFLWSLLLYQAGTPLTYIYFKDKNRLKLGGRVLVKSGEKGIVGSSGRSSAYEELIQFIETKKNMGVRPTQLTGNDLKCFLFVNCVGLTPIPTTGQSSLGHFGRNGGQQPNRKERCSTIK